MNATRDPFVHYVLEPGLARDPDRPCANAIFAGSDRAYGDHDRDLTVFRSDGPLPLRDVRWDGSPDGPESGTWHFRQFCPSGSWDRPHHSGPFVPGFQPAAPAVQEAPAGAGAGELVITRPDDPDAQREQYSYLMSALDRAAAGEIIRLVNQHGHSLILLVPDGQQGRALGVRKSPHADMPGLRITLGMAGAGSSAGLNHAADAVASDNPCWIVDQAGIAVAVIIPAQDWHAPGTCCCQHCPWNSNHGTR